MPLGNARSGSRTAFEDGSRLAHRGCHFLEIHLDGRTTPKQCPYGELLLGLEAARQYLAFASPNGGETAREVGSFKFNCHVTFEFKG